VSLEDLNLVRAISDAAPYFDSATVTGATSTAIATGGVIAIANVAGAVAPYLFRAKDA
jgi:hypothetical protein